MYVCVVCVCVCVQGHWNRYNCYVYGRTTFLVVMSRSQTPCGAWEREQVYDVSDQRACVYMYDYACIMSHCTLYKYISCCAA